MNMKNFIIGGLVGGLVNWLLGWLFYGILFTDLYPKDGNLLYITIGCFGFGFLISYIFNKWAGIRTLNTGLMTGANIGLLYGIADTFFISSHRCISTTNMILMIVLGVVATAITGAVIGLVNGKMSDPDNA